MTAKSSMTGADLLEHPVLWREFHKRLSMGADAEHDRQAIKAFADMLKLSPHRVVNKMRTFCHPSNGTIH